MLFNARASKDGGIAFDSDYVKAHFKTWLKENSDHPFKIESVDKVSQELRGYYFAAVIPLIRSTCDEWEKLNNQEMHEVIKKLFFYFETYNPVTKRNERFGRSVMADSEWNNTRKAMKFLEVLAEYLGTCGLEMPDSKEYTRWRDSAPMKGEEYKKS